MTWNNISNKIADVWRPWELYGMLVVVCSHSPPPLARGQLERAVKTWNVLLSTATLQDAEMTGTRSHLSSNSHVCIGWEYLQTVGSVLGPTTEVFLNAGNQSVLPAMLQKFPLASGWSTWKWLYDLQMQGNYLPLFLVEMDIDEEK